MKMTMKLKNKLILTFCIMSILPMVLCGLVICGMYKIHAQNMYQTYEIDSQTFLIDFYSPMELMGKITENIYDDIREIAEENPEKFNDESYLEHIDYRLSEKLSELVVRKNGVYTYQSEVLKGKNIDELLPAYDEDENICDVALYKGGDYQTLVKQINFSDSQGNEYSVSILTSLNQIVPQLKMFAIELFAAVFLILVITSLILNLWIYRSVVTPLNKLKLATHNIQAGNFDFEMPNVPKNEIGDVCRDFEEMRVILKQSSEDKIRSDMEEKELIRNISHDLKTPLTVARGNAELLAMTSLDAEQMDLLEHFQKGIAQVDAYVKELAELNKASLKKTLMLEEVPVKEFVEDIYDQTLSLAQTKQINVVFDKKEIEKETIGNWDRSLLNRAFMNIVSNAVEHTPSGSQLLLTARGEDDEFKFICLDSGPGFSLESLEKATQLFYQEDKSRQSRNHSGLGLTIANDIIRLHHGSLSLSNDNGTGGAKVTIILPL